jgi:hypothetical protein
MLGVLDCLRVGPVDPALVLEGGGDGLLQIHRFLPVRPIVASSYYGFALEISTAVVVREKGFDQSCGRWRDLMNLAAKSWDENVRNP